MEQVRAQQAEAVGLLEAPDLVVEPAAVAWARRLATRLAPGTSAAELSESTAELLADELRADHVGLWRLDGEDYVVLASAGLTEGARRMRLSQTYPVVNVCRGTGGTLRRDGDNHQGPRAPGLPGSGSPAYAMLMLQGDGPVRLVTMSGPRLSAEEVEQVRTLLAVLPWGQTSA